MDYQRSFYIAGSFKNSIIINDIANKLCQFDFLRTYDWTKNNRAENLLDLKKIANKEYKGVKECDFMVFVFPGGKGSNIEFGIAKAFNKKIYILDTTNEINLPEKTSTFYHMDNVFNFQGDTNEFINFVLSKEQ